MAFKVAYNYKPHTFDENNKYIDNDTYTIFVEDCKMTRNNNGNLDISTKTISLTINEDELNELWTAINKAVAERNDIRGYHE